MLNTLGKFDGDFKMNIMKVAHIGEPKIEIGDIDDYMKKIIDLYTQINIHLNFVDPFKVVKVEALPLVSDGKVNMCDLLYIVEGEVLEKKYNVVDFDKILNDEIMKMIMERYNSYIKELQDEKSELYQENILRVKKSVLYLLKQAKLKYASRKTRFKLSNEIASDGSYIIVMSNKMGAFIEIKDGQIDTESKKSEDVSLKVKKPHTLREKDFKNLLLKAVRKMNLLMK